MKALHILALLALLAATLSAAAAGIERELPPPDFYSRHAEALGLTEEQRDRMRDVFQRGEREFREVREELARREAALRDAVTDGVKPEAEIMERLQAMLASESEAKAIQFRGHLALRRLLTPEQLEKARPLIAKAAEQPSAQDRAKMEEMRARLQERFEQIKAQAKELFRDSEAPEELRQMGRAAEEKLKGGDLDGARQLLERALQELEKERVKRGGASRQN